MIFSSPIFLFLFLPIVLVLYLIAGRRFRNATLLFASLLFYIWGENIYVLVMLSSIVLNYFIGLWIDLHIQNNESGKGPLTVGIIANVSLLVFFKYANFLVENINNVLGYYGFSVVHVNDIHLPIGISFFTFQAMSYIIDIYRKESRVQKNPLNLGLYISLFPQLIAGPIVRYKDISDQIRQRQTTLSGFASGAERFIFGLGKKMLLANPLGEMADRIFELPIDQLSAGTAWLGVVCFSLQIYFDFSGYSDMAIGIGRMFGFRFLENFNYPYISRSIREFWRRWHISLSTWYRDYLYIPMGGNKSSDFRTGLNLLTVFLLCGLWHGASWNFLIWGMLHGLFLIAERGMPGRILSRLPAVIQFSYATFVVINTWVFFRLDELSDALNYMNVMYGGSSVHKLYPFVVQSIDTVFVLTLTFAVVLSAPVYPAIRSYFSQLIYANKVSSSAIYLLYSIKFLLVTSVLVFSLSSIAAGSYNPFIYFRF